MNLKDVMRNSYATFNQKNISGADAKHRVKSIKQKFNPAKKNEGQKRGMKHVT